MPNIPIWVLGGTVARDLWLAGDSLAVGRVGGAVTNNTVFIDGEAGTTGLQIRERLADVAGITVRSIDSEVRKDPTARQEMMRDADLVVLCLPDDAAREAVALIDALGEDAPKIVDASSAHRVSDGWVYGFAEMCAGQRDEISRAMRVSNPGCYPTGGIALLRPLVEKGIVAPDYPITVNAVSGYSGGGRSMIESYEAGSSPAFQLYGLSLAHKHVPELLRYSKLSRRPIFVPSVGNFARGMLVSIPLHLDTLIGKPSVGEIRDVLGGYYQGAAWVYVAKTSDEAVRVGSLAANEINDRDRMELRVFGNDDHRQAVLVARLDNLGKGAAGAAVQNIKLMLGV